MRGPIRNSTVTRPRGGDRGQAYTLEGFVASIVVLTAVLFALQAVVITPTTGGSVDRTVQAQLQGEARDALLVAENEGDLTETVLYWEHDPDDGTPSYYNSSEVPAQFGYYELGQFGNESTLGKILEERFTESGRSYNVEMLYRNETADSAADSRYLVYQGSPTANAFTASYTVALTDDQRLTAPGSRDVTVAEAGEDHDFPIPNVDEASELYNVVEVRIVVW